MKVETKQTKRNLFLEPWDFGLDLPPSDGDLFRQKQADRISPHVTVIINFYFQKSIELSLLLLLWNSTPFPCRKDKPNLISISYSRREWTLNRHLISEKKIRKFFMEMLWHFETD